jgi:hypothetical protein
MIAFAFSDDLSWAVFSTPIATRKYHLLSECDCVCLAVDNRPHYYKERVDPRARYRRAP